MGWDEQAVLQGEGRGLDQQAEVIAVSVPGVALALTGLAVLGNGGIEDGAVDSAGVLGQIIPDGAWGFGVKVEPAVIDAEDFDVGLRAGGTEPIATHIGELVVGVSRGKSRGHAEDRSVEMHC